MRMVSQSFGGVTLDHLALASAEQWPTALHAKTMRDHTTVLYAVGYGAIYPRFHHPRARAKPENSGPINTHVRNLCSETMRAHPRTDVLRVPDLALRANPGMSGERVSLFR